MINLFIPYYVDKSEARQAELITCLQNNLNNKAVRVHIIVDSPFIDPVDFGLTTRVTLIHYRPTYNAMFDIINSITGPDDWNVLINSDIYTDYTIELLNNYDSNDFIALARWDVDKAGNPKLLDRWDAQDAWAFKGKTRKMNADFFQGIAGCDNAIADRAEKAGYRVLNPSKTIKIYHLHNSGVRNYNPSNRIPGPYKLIHPAA